MKKEKRYFGRLLMILALIFFYLPIVFMMVISFNSSKSLTSFTGFSLKWYQATLCDNPCRHSSYNYLYGYWDNDSNWLIPINKTCTPLCVSR